jgi:ABC-type branched-subunit amino acid transport system substrate-binding protein
MGLRRRLWNRGVSVGLVAAAAGGMGCAQVVGIEPNPTVEAPHCVGTAHVRIASDFSGTATDIAIPHFYGIYDYMRNLNDNGGLDGCAVDVQVADNHYTGPGTQAVVDEWRNNDADWQNVNAVFTFGTGPTQTVAPGVMAENKVIIPGSYAGGLDTPVGIEKSVIYPVVNNSYQEAANSEEKKSAGYPYVFFPATDYGTAIRLAIQVAWQVAPGRMAMAHDDNPPCAYCVDPLAAGKSYIRNLQGMDLGRDLLFKQTSDPADTKGIDDAVQAYFTAEVAHVIDDPTYMPVSWVWSGNSVYSSSVLGQSIARIQHDLIDNNADSKFPAALKPGGAGYWKLRVIANNWGIGETTPGICGTACNDDNFYGLFPVPGYGDIQNATGMAELIALHDTYANKDNASPPAIPQILRANTPDDSPRTPEQYRDVRYVQGYVAALMWHKGMLAAIKAGHRQPSGEDLKTALETFSNVDMQGLTADTIGFSATDHRPQSGENIYKLDKNGQFVFVKRYSISLVPEWLGW